MANISYQLEIVIENIWKKNDVFVVN